MPGNVEVERGLRSANPDSAERPLRYFTEFLDHPEFSGAACENTMTAYLLDKYAQDPPDTVVFTAGY